MRRDKVIQYTQAIFKVAQYRILDDLASCRTTLTRLRHQTPDTSQLFYLLLTTTGTWIKHHVHRVETLLISSHFTDQRFSYTCINTTPDIDDLVVTLVVSDKTHVIAIPYFVYFTLCIFNQLLFHFRNDQIVNVERKTTLEGCTETKCLDIIKELSRFWNVRDLDNVADNFTKVFLR